MIRKTLFLALALLIRFCSQSFAQCDTSAFAPDSIQIITYGTVKTMKKHQDTLYVGGAFSMIGKFTGSFIGMDTVTGKPANQPTWPKSNGTVLDAVSDGNGGWVLVGNFTVVDGLNRTNVAHINSAGQVTTLNVSVNGIVNVALVNSSVLYIGGAFSSVNSTTRNRAAAIDLSTGLLTSWDPNCNGDVNALAVDGSTIYIGGAFTNVGGNARSRIAAVSASTGIATSWAPTGIANNSVLSIVVKNNKVYAGGSFTTPYNRLAALDKSTGSTITWNPNSSGIVRDLLLIRNLLYVAGDFSTINSVTRANIAAVDTLSGIPSSWYPTLAATTLSDIHCIASNGSNIYAGGDKRIVIIDTTSATVKAISPNVGGTVYTLVSGTDKVFAGGNFAGLGLTKRSNIAGINLIDWSIIPFSLDVSTAINDIEIDNGKMYIAGDFYIVNSTSRNRLACLNMTSNYTLLPFDPFSATSIGDVNDMVISGANMYVVGKYNTPPRKLDKISGAIDASWSLNPFYAYSEVYKIRQVGNDLFLGGFLQNSTTAHGFVKHNLTTGTTTGFQFGNPVRTFAADANKVYCTGTFYGQPLASPMFLESLNINPFDDNSWHPNPNFELTGMEVDKGRVYLGGGSLTNFGAIPRKGVAIADTVTGKIASGWHPAVSGDIFGFLPLGDTLYAYGNHSEVSGKRIAGITRFHLNYSKPVVTVAPTNGFVCASTNTGFTATVSPSIAGISYQWKKNGANVGTNSANYSYTPVTGDVLTCIITLPPTNNLCYIDNQIASAPYNVTTTPNASLSVSITASTPSTVCTGTSVTYTATSNVSGVSYQWYKFPNPISGATNSTYTYTPQNGDNIHCRVTAAGCYTPLPAISNSISMTVNNYITGTSVTSVANNPICQGANASFNVLSTMNLNGNPNFQWKVNGLNAGPNSNSFSYPAVNNDVVTCEVTATTGCYNPNPATSTPITMSVTPNVTPTISISGNTQPECEGNMITYTATANPSGTYLWKVNGTPVGFSTTMHAYVPAMGDQISCELAVPAGCFTAPTATSNTLTANLVAKTTPTISLNSVPMASLGTTVTVNATVANAGSNYVIDWKNNGTGFATTNTPSATYVKGAGKDNITAEITPQGCYTKATSAAIIVNVSTYVQDLLEARGISVFPNPFTGHVIVKGLKKDDKLSLYDVLGRNVGSYTISETGIEQKLQVNDMAPGTYLLYITDGSTSESVGAIKLQKQ
ncbi:T9SS type A sorting domain-containing protein [Polluticoccus soli]|uniref:T9SS type A sorting domain-containing protein n=1 Tax=Polluticoccus soli TaxID=3034150 RepID=UPI0023E343CD|nr:T9SS type A sorting domain-containing protein [Flavipsychrobacter sp. JY13-12]